MDAKQKHTPGPWRVGTPDHDDPCYAPINGDNWYGLAKGFIYITTSLINNRISIAKIILDSLVI